VEVLGEAAELADWGVGPARRHGDEVALAADVDACGIRVLDGEFGTGAHRHGLSRNVIIGVPSQPDGASSKLILSSGVP
jgi:hypothetical protein